MLVAVRRSGRRDLCHRLLPHRRGRASVALEVRRRRDVGPQDSLDQAPAAVRGPAGVLLVVRVGPASLLRSEPRGAQVSINGINNVL